MNRVTRGTVVLAAALAALTSCKGDPTDSLRNGVDHLVATPSEIYPSNGETRTVLIEAVDEQGNRVSTNFSLASVGAGITVVEDSAYNQVFDAKGNPVQVKGWPRSQYKVLTNSYLESSFTVSAGGKSITIPVRTYPGTLTGAISNTAPNNGDTVTISAPAGISFNPTTTNVSIGGSAAFITNRTATSVSFVPPPGASGQASVTNVTLDYAPAAGNITTVTEPSFTVEAIPPSAIAPANAQVGDTVTITLPAPFKWTSNSHISVPGASAVVFTGVSADSSTVTFRIGPNSDTTVVVDSTVVSGANGLGRYTLTSGTKLSSPLVPTFPSTFSDTTPAWGDTVTITAAAGYKFLPTANMTIGGVAPIIVSRAPDSSAITFIPYPTGGLPAKLTLTNVVFATATSLPLTLPSQHFFQAAPGKTTAGAIATAPTITIPATGLTSTFVDAGGFTSSADCDQVGVDCRFYKFTLATSRTFQVTLRWGNTADLGGYFLDANGNDLFGDFACDAHGSGASGQPETCSQTLPAGTYWLALANFSAARPGTVRIDILGQ